MQPERPIEKLLRDYASRRRDNAGAPAELHPATRRLLHSEVARVFGTEDARTRGSEPGFSHFWRRLALGAGTVCIVGIGVAALVMVSTHRNSTLELAANRTASSAGITSQPSAAPSALPPAEPLQAPATKELADTAAAAPPALEAARAANAAPQPDADTKGQTAFLRRYGLVPPSATQGVAALPGTANAGVASSATAQPEPSGLVNQPSPSAPLASAALSFAVTNAAIQTPAGTALAAVLAAFRLEGSGQDFRIIDADGSVYRGWVVGPGLSQPSLTSADRVAPRSAPAAQSSVRERSLAIDGAGPQANLKRTDRGLDTERAPVAGALGAGVLPSYPFKVSGTNRTLGRLVVFTGQLLGPTNSVPWVRTNLGAELKAGPVVSERDQVAGDRTVAPMAKRLVVGKLTIGTNQPIDLRAVPAQP